MEKHAPDHSGKFLAADIGNTHTVLGLFKRRRLLSSWRIPTREETTGDELFSIVSPFLAAHEVGWKDLDTILVSSVVPPAAEAWADLAERCAGPEFRDAHDLVLELVTISYPHPYEVGTDRLLNSLAAFRRFRTACIVVDYGTATTFDCISERGEYMGGTIAPGILLAARSLFSGTSKLPMVRFPRERVSVLGKNTEGAIQAGLLYGFAGLTDNIIDNLAEIFEKRPLVVSTGGLSPILFDYCKNVDRLEPTLTMEALLYCHDHLMSARPANAPG